MLAARLTARCSSARLVTPAVLSGYLLSFGKKDNDGSDKPALVATYRPESQVYGALFKIGCDDLIALDLIEGRGKGYERIEGVHVK